MRSVCALPALTWAARYNAMQIFLYIAASIRGSARGEGWGLAGGTEVLGGWRCRCCKEATMLWAADGTNLDCTEIRKILFWSAACSVLVSE